MTFDSHALGHFALVASRAELTIAPRWGNPNDPNESAFQQWGRLPCANCLSEKHCHPWMMASVNAQTWLAFFDRDRDMQPLFRKGAKWRVCGSQVSARSSRDGLAPQSSGPDQIFLVLPRSMYATWLGEAGKDVYPKWCITVLTWQWSTKTIRPRSSILRQEVVVVVKLLLNPRLDINFRDTHGMRPH